MTTHSPCLCMVTIEQASGDLELSGTHLSVVIERCGGGRGTLALSIGKDAILSKSQPKGIKAFEI